jgi:hypothetical protein
MMHTIKAGFLARFSQPQSRRGNIILLSAFVITMALGFAAFSIDIGYLAVAKGQLQSAVDAAALAAAMELNPNIDQTVVETNVKNAASEVADLNPVGNHSGLLLDPSVDVELGRRDWDATNSTFVFSFGPSAVPYNIVRVTGRLDDVWNAASGQMENRKLPLFFAPAIDQDDVTMQVGSVATYQPRDMVLVLDYSGSMNDDTEFKSVGSLGQQTIENAITTMWHELGDPSYGIMPFVPDYLTVTLPAASPNIPEVVITYRGTEMDISSTANIDRIKLGFSGGGHEDFINLTGSSGTFAGIAVHAGQRIDHVHVWSGSMTDQKVEFDNNAIEAWLELDQVTYPHPAGSWIDFIDYVSTDNDVVLAGFKYQYSMMCLINYWNEQQPKYSQTTGLSVCTTQPLTAAKNASDVLCDYITAVEADDKVGLSIYTHTNSDGATLENGLTHNVASIKPLYRNRQAGHYDTLTNIGGGLKVAREELENNGRQDAYRVIVLMTDGVANRPSGSAEQWAIDQANLCKASKIKIMAIALGLGADENLMLQLANITGGKRFIVPGGGTIAEYEAQLMQVFQDIAADRPLKLLPTSY